MPFPVTGTQGPKLAEKTKAKGATNAAGGPSFASLLAGALEESPNAAESSPAASLGGTLATPLSVWEDDTPPPNTREQARSLMQTLKELAGETMAEQPPSHLERLQRLSEATGADENALTPQQQQVMNEARTRAAVEAAKRKP
jgi:hypothetical protein